MFIEQHNQAQVDRHNERRRCWPRVVVALALCTAGVAVLAPDIVLHTRLRSIVVRKLLSERAAQIEFDSVTAGWRTPLSARGIRYRDAALKLDIESAHCDRTLLDLVLHPRDFGRVRLESPRAFIIPSVHSSPVPTHTGSTAAPAAGGARQAAPKRLQHWPMIEVMGTGGEFAVLGASGSPVSVAHHVDFELAAPADASTATFHVLARTGDPSTTAHFSASGTLDWPVQSWLGSLGELQLEVVGTEASVIDQLLAIAGLPVSTTAVSDRHTPVQIQGRVSGAGTARRDSTHSLRFELKLEIEACELALPSHAFLLCEPTVGVSAVGRIGSGAIQLDAAQIATEAITLDASGTVSDYSRKAIADLAGTMLCDWQKIGARLRALAREDFALSGRSRRPWRLAGPLRGSSGLKLVEKLQIDVATAIDELSLFELNAGPLELSAHWRDGVVRFDPVTTTFQGGQVAFQPTIQCLSQTPLLSIAPGRVLDKVTLDPKLCEWVLRYVDPLSTVSGNLQGSISMDLDELEIPLDRQGLERGVVQGRVLLDDVEFSPDQSLEEILAVAGIQIPANLRTSQSIVVRLENGRVYHEGLALPLKDHPVTLDGWVALDHTMQIRLSLPVTEEMLGRDKRLYRLLRSQRIDVPIYGTLEKPKLSDEALSRNIQRLIQTTLRQNLLGQEALRGFLRRVTK